MDASQAERALQNKNIAKIVYFSVNVNHIFYLASVVGLVCKLQLYKTTPLTAIALDTKLLMVTGFWKYNILE